MKPENMDVFKLSHEVVLETYKFTKDFPDEEKFGLVSQMRRSCSSVPMNIMEGAGRWSTKEYIRFLSIASGSCEEFKYQLLLSRDLDYIDESKYDQLNEKCVSISKMLYKLSESLKRKL
jgi:four helix bundle protein